MGQPENTVFIQPAEFPETLMPISAEVPDLSSPTAAQGFLCCVAGPYSPAFWFLPSTVVLLGGGGRPGLKLLTHLKVLSSPRTAGWKAALLGSQPHFLKFLIPVQACSAALWALS